MKRTSIAIAMLCFGGAALAQSQAIIVVNQAITQAEVEAAQQGWCQALLDIGATHAKSGQPAAKALAEKVIDSAYGYQMGAYCSSRR